MLDAMKSMVKKKRIREMVNLRKALRNAEVKMGNVPRFLRAVETLKGGGTIDHFVEWHNGDDVRMTKPTSFTQACVYLDLGEVSDIE